MDYKNIDFLNTKYISTVLCTSLYDKIYIQMHQIQVQMIQIPGYLLLLQPIKPHHHL